MDEIIFSITNELTGWSVHVYDRHECFTVEQYDVDGTYMGGGTFTSESRAISHAVLCS